MEIAKKSPLFSRLSRSQLISVPLRPAEEQAKRGSENRREKRNLKVARSVHLWFGAMGLIPIAAFAMVVMLNWFETRRKEKEIALRHELLRIAAQSQSDGASKVLDMILDQDNQEQLRKREGMKLGGLISMAVGVSLMPFFYFIVPGQTVWIMGGIPFMVGLVLTAYVFWLSPKSGQERP